MSVIAIDLDNTLNNLQEVVIDVFNEKYGTHYSLNDMKTYNISECLNKEDAINMKALYSKPGIYNTVKPLPGAQNVLQKLKKYGHEVYIVTHSVPSIFAEKVEWVKYHFGIDEAHIVAMQHKWHFNCDIMIEDNMDNLLGSHNYERICFDYPWNRMGEYTSDLYDQVYGIYRVSHWNEVLNIVNKICNKE